ncbi:TRAP transporter substrate-binding protein DctP [Xanthobacter sp. DSM 24535]|uniref:TRAP transporter substrate-binding protein n=1 Tax=Roseixanthobacter psychrophilus TaxID=3119917 RepID=UPI00372B43AF
MKTLFTFLAAVTALFMLPCVGHAQVKLRVADALPANHFFVEQATRFWMQEVTRETKGAVTFEYYPAEQLGKAKDILSLTQSGVIDVGYVVPSYVSDKMPLTAVAELPSTYSTSCAGTLAYWKLARGDGALARREYEPNGVKVMFAIVMPPYQIFSAQKKIDGLKSIGLKSIEGQKLRTTGGAQDGMVLKLKGIPVRMTAPELHESLSRGTVDGMVFPTASVLAYDLAGLVKSGTANENFGSAVLTYMISNTRWNAMSPAVQKAMLDAGDAATRRVCAYADREVENDLARIRQKGGTLAPLPAADRASAAPMMSAVRQDWAAQLDKRSRPGTEVLNAFEEALK